MIKTTVGTLEWESENDYSILASPVKKDPILRPNFDVLTAACHLYSGTRDTTYAYRTLKGILVDGELINLLITKDDIATAKNLKKTFNNKYLLKNLQNQPLTKFEKSTQDLLQNLDEFPLSYLNILVKLPEFFEYDNELKDLYKDYVSASNAVNIRPRPIQQYNIKYVKSMYRMTASSKIVSHFFVNDENNLIVFPSNIADSEATKLWDLVKKIKNLSVKGLACTQHDVNHNFNLLRIFDYDFDC